MFTEAFAGETTLVCYAMKANSNQSVLRTLAKLGAGADVVSGGELKRALAAGIPPEQDRVLRRRQDRRRTARGARRGHPLHQRRIRARARTAVAGSRSRLGSTARDLGARQSRRRCRHPRQDLHRQVREQVRHSDRARARGLRPRRQAARHRGRPASTCISAARSPISARWKPRSACWRISSRRCAPTATPSTHVDFGGGLGIPYHEDRDAPPLPSAYAAMVKRVTHNLGCTLMFEPGRMIVGNAGILVAARRSM